MQISCWASEIYSIRFENLVISGWTTFDSSNVPYITTDSIFSFIPESTSFGAENGDIIVLCRCQGTLPVVRSRAARSISRFKLKFNVQLSCQNLLTPKIRKSLCHMVASQTAECPLCHIAFTPFIPPCPFNLGFQLLRNAATGIEVDLSLRSWWWWTWKKIVIILD